MLLIVKPKAIIVVLSGVILCLLLAHMAGQVSVYYFGFNADARLVRLFDLDNEGNIPTLFSTIILLTASLLFAALPARRKQRRIPIFCTGVDWRSYSSSCPRMRRWRFMRF